MSRFLRFFMGGVVGLSLMVAGGCGNGTEPPPDDGQGGGVKAPPRDFHLVVEAESGAVGGTFAVTEEDNTGGGKCIRIPTLPKDFKGERGRAVFTVDLPAARPAYIWLRAHWGGTCANSVHLQLPVGPQRIVGEDATYRAWHWVKGPQGVELPAGKVEIRIDQREDTLGIDQILITSDKEYVPQGVE